MVGDFNNTVSNTVGLLNVLSWGQVTENETEVGFTPASDFASMNIEHTGH